MPDLNPSSAPTDAPGQHRPEAEDQGSERRLLRTVIDIVPDYIYVKDRQSRFVVNNAAVAQNLGMTSEQVNGKSDFDFFPEALARQFYEDEQRVMASGTPLISREEPNYYPQTGTWGWHLTTTVPLRNLEGEVIGLVGVSRDITSHKKMEEAVRESLVHQKFARQLIDSQELERKRIAAELHDHLGQKLLLVKNHMLLASRAAQQGESAVDLDEALALVTEALQDVREISHSLRPHLIDELGLSKSIESMVRRLARSSQLAATMDIEPVDRLLAKDAEINLYRIAQESLNNVVKHADAKAVTVVLRRTGHSVLLRVVDDGCGFEVEALTRGAERHASFGLMIMAERANMMGGEFELKSDPGLGTTLSVILPIKEGLHGA
ncbi:PAS domain-containing protein [Geothrix sp. PMB-07]|uniref:PAS domain-containing sensor histidine kinase n=1 Tax=Geothrix sp. PMB-07 TaxID=3068640 RepID=UPI0027420F6A|nr:PAS domain-containing protein [Geothrix sp. PMB-07]WLT33463.1 PAS domain-containing protein [Geothrix sp. PMB-07]